MAKKMSDDEIVEILPTGEVFTFSSVGIDIEQVTFTNKMRYFSEVVVMQRHGICSFYLSKENKTKLVKSLAQKENARTIKKQVIKPYKLTQEDKFYNLIEGVK